MKPPVVVLGATGQVGLFAIDQLLAAGRSVIAVTRKPGALRDTDLEGLQRVGAAQVSQELEELQSVTPGVRFSLLSCGPLALARDVLQAEGLKAPTPWERVVVVGTTSTTVKKRSRDEQERRLIAEIELALTSVRERCLALGAPLTLLSPTLIYGCGMDENLSRVCSWIRRAGFAPLAVNSQGLRQPLHVADLAGTIVTALQIDPPAQVETVVCGGSQLSYKEMIARLFSVTGRKEKFISLPAVMFPVVSALSRLVPGAGPVSSEMFRRQSRDLVFDDGLARSQFGHTPRAFEPSEADFRLPGNIESIRLALNLHSTP